MKEIIVAITIRYFLKLLCYSFLKTCVVSILEKIDFPQKMSSYHEQFYWLRIT